MFLATCAKEQPKKKILTHKQALIRPEFDIQDQIHRMYVSAMKLVPPQLVNDAYIAGGFYSNLFCSDKTQSDIDVFFKTQQSAQKAKQHFTKLHYGMYLANVGHIKLTSDFFRTGSISVEQFFQEESPFNLVRLQPKGIYVNLVFFNFGQPLELIRMFDFRHSMAYYDGKTLHVEHKYQAQNLVAKLNEKRRYKSRNVSSRLVKFINRGYEYEQKQLLMAVYNRLTIDTPSQFSSGTQFYGDKSTQNTQTYLSTALQTISSSSCPALSQKYDACPKCLGYGHVQQFDIKEQHTWNIKQKKAFIQQGLFPKYKGRCLVCSGCGIIQKNLSNNNHAFTDQHRTAGLRYSKSRGYHPGVITALGKQYKQHLIMIKTKQQMIGDILKGMFFCLKRGLDPYKFIHSSFTCAMIIQLAVDYLKHRDEQILLGKKTIKVLQNA